MTDNEVMESYRESAARRGVVSAPPLVLAEESSDLPDVAAHVPAGGGPPLFITADPARITTIDETISWLRANRAALDGLIIRHGGIVLRGFPVRSSRDFGAVVDTFPSYSRGYVGGGGSRARISDKVMEATQLSETMNLTLHSEMGYLKTYPKRIAFYCAKPAEFGGETTIGSMRAFIARLPNDLRERIRENGARTIRNLAPAGASRGQRVSDHPDKRGWDETFDTEDRVEVEAHCAAMAMEAIWNEDGSLTLISEAEPFAHHPATGELCYRSQMHTNRSFEADDRRAITEALRASQKMRSRHTMLNGEEMPQQDADMVARIFSEITVAWPWHSGDVMILDNLLVSHGRHPYAGTRDVQVALLD